MVKEIDVNIQSGPLADALVRSRDCVRLDTRAGTALVDGAEYAVRLGCWMFFIPATGEKFFHAHHGMTDCIHATRPTDEQLGAEWSNETYASADWRRALSTPLDRRLAEVWVAMTRLSHAGLGPLPRGVTFARRLERDAVSCGPTMGIICENVDELPAKPPCDDAAMRAAGVIPDRIRSSVRQQLRGYVVDLCSVVGVQPVDAEEEVRAVQAWVRASRPTTAAP